jgi:hypothetical protein
MSEQKEHLGVGARLREGPAPELVASAFVLEAGDGPLLYHGMNLAWTAALPWYESSRPRPCGDVD